MKTLRKWARAACAAILLWAIGMAHAQSDWVRAGVVQARLVSSSSAIGQQSALSLGLHLRLDEGWKTYWRTPGETGLAPSLDWSGSTNVEKVELSYPAPKRFEFEGIQSFGYQDEVVLPLTATIGDPRRPAEVTSSVELLVCKDICVPQQMQLSLPLPPGTATPSAEASLISRYVDMVPGNGEAHGISVDAIELLSGEGRELVVRAAATSPFSQPDAFVEGLPQTITLGAPEIKLSSNGMSAAIALPVQGEASASELKDSVLRVTLVDGPRHADVNKPVSTSGSSLGQLMLAFALLGGLVLNLMPCVLPVLSLKLLSVTHASSGGPKKVRTTFLATAAGIVFSFMLLAAGAISLKAAGVAIGWGVQFQQPLFLVFMVVLVALFAANLWGFFEIPLPRALADLAGGGGAGHDKLAGSFATGAFATLLATPCSAPFLGTAVGFALAGAPSDIVAVFAALGVGMALPYLLVAAFPGMAGWIPRPGPWMVKVRVVLGFALAATGVWLLWVMQAQTGWVSAWTVGTLMLALWGLLAWQHRFSELAKVATAGAIALSAAAFAVPILLAETPPARATTSAYTWKEFDPGAIGREVAAGKVVFVDVTADWCVTCQVNKRMVTYQGEVAKALFSGEDIVPMQADWTSPDARIADYLASFRRYGIPFNVVYGPGAPKGIVLSEVLTESAVLDALARAAGKGLHLK